MPTIHSVYTRSLSLFKGPAQTHTNLFHTWLFPEYIELFFLPIFLPALRRKLLLERLELERDVYHGARLLLLCLLMFTVVISAAIIESQTSVRLGMSQKHQCCKCAIERAHASIGTLFLEFIRRFWVVVVAGILNTYKSLFSLDDSLADIKTRDNLFDYLYLVSEQTQLIQPGEPRASVPLTPILSQHSENEVRECSGPIYTSSLIATQMWYTHTVSSVYLVEETGELKILSGLRSFHKAEIVEVEGLSPRVDSPSWSMMAWVKLPLNGGATILRKPLRPLHQLSCWYAFSSVHF